jgi:hypothetical protein
MDQNEIDMNRENFRDAVDSLKSNEAMWAHQIHLMIGHSVALDLDFGSLEGRYDRVRPFIHQGLAAVLDAFAQPADDRSAWHRFLHAVQRITIAGCNPDRPLTASLTRGALAVCVPLADADEQPPTDRVIAAFHALAAAIPPRHVSYGAPEPDDD